MISLKALINTFTGKLPVERIASQNISIKEGILNYAVPFLLVKILLSFELVIFSVISGFLSGVEIVQLAINTAILIVILLIAIPLLLIAEIVFLYLISVVEYLIAGIYRKERSGMNNYAGSLITVFASVKLVAGLLLAIPIIGWIASVVALLYSILLNFRFVKARFNLSEPQAAIIVLLPANLVMLFLLMIVTAISFFLIGTKVL